MSLHQPARRLVQTARSAAAAAAAPNPALRLLPYTQRRHASWNPFSWGRKAEAKADPLTAELTRRENEKKMMDRMADRTAGASIFEDEIKETEAKTTKSDVPGADMYAPTLVKEHVMRAVDPDPRWRVRWQRKKVMQMVRNGNKMTKEQRLKLVEKDHVFQSDNMETSTKKLVHLAHQVAGKTVEDAITQMRFSKKKMGKQLVYYLELARDEAIAKRGMGLGAVNGELLPAPRQIRVKDGTKDGRLVEVTDPTRLYVDQAWVGKGPFRGFRMQYHARGRQSAMWKPSTHINFVLKEEKTRIRLHEAKVDKQAKAKPWVHLPNRPITAQRQHYTW